MSFVSLYLLRENQPGGKRWGGVVVGGSPLVFQEMGIKVGGGQAWSLGSWGRKASEFAVTVSVNENWPAFQALEGKRSWHLWKTISEIRFVPTTEPNPISSVFISKKVPGHQFAGFMSTKQMINDQGMFCQQLWVYTHSGKVGLLTSYRSITACYLRNKDAGLC